MTPVERLRATYAREPVDRLVRTNFGWWPQTIERWRDEGLQDDPREAFCLDPMPLTTLARAGWCDSPFVPPFEEKVLEVRDGYEIRRDASGRVTRLPEGQTTGVMPTFLDAPVKSRRDWEEEIKPRMDPQSPERYGDLRNEGEKLAREVKAGQTLHNVPFVGAYMHLRNLFGPEDVLYVFHDDPALIHDVMQNWLEVVCAVCTAAQDVAPLFRISAGEDICYKNGPLISPRMYREFLKPYYAELWQTLNRRQDELVHFYYDTDGDPSLLADDIFAAGVDMLMPLEVAAGCDVQQWADRYPEVAFSGGVDKRVLAGTKDQIDQFLERIIPPMLERSGYIPMCDHSVPHDVPLENFIHYRNRLMALGTPTAGDPE
jgi:uroporphyrinogen decarboxylase